MSTDAVRDTLIYFFEQAAGFRASLIPKDDAWNPKNEKHATCLNGVLDYVRGLPDDSPTLQTLRDFGGCWDEDLDSKWNDVIHCDTDDPAAWFEDWAKGLTEVSDEDEDDSEGDEWERI